ncbi:MAG: OmpA family protein [Lachnospiraceae bacterium]|jgi:chemotaxis protein MotB|nr:OmpA family protein [Lachnospiraceae bacterium]
MAKKKAEDPPKGSPAWMATFSDLMNLLLCFFVLLFSMSSVDANKWEEVVVSMTSAFSVFDVGSQAIGEGSLVGVGTAQLSNLDEYYASLGQKSEETGEEMRASGDSEIDESIKNLLASQGVEEDVIDKMSKTGEITVEILADMYEDGKLDESLLKLLAALGMIDVDLLDKLMQSDLMEKMLEDGAVDEELLEQLRALAEMAAMADNNQGPTEVKDIKQMVSAAGMIETTEMFEKISEITEIYNMNDDLALSIDEGGTYVEMTIPGSLLFESGSATLTEKCKPLLLKVGDILKLYPDNYVDVIGHTDNIPINNAAFSSNDILSSARAISAAQFIVKNCGIDIKRVGWTGRGEYEPVDTNDTSEGRAKNRRVEIRLYNSYNSK